MQLVEGNHLQRRERHQHVPPSLTNAKNRRRLPLNSRSCLSGSNALAYRHNAMRYERTNALGRYQQTLLLEPAETACRQWVERSVKGSANRHLVVIVVFLSTDATLQ
eukprot:IDg4322t1